MQFAMKEIVRSFEELHQVDCDVILGSSGKLTAQIIEGAPYDIFVSADTIYPHVLNEKGLADSKPLTYAYGRLVLWSLIEGIFPTMDSLSSTDVSHVAIANPKTAPYGVASVTALKKANLFASIEAKIVYGESIAQVNQFISTQAAELGITSKSVVLSQQMKGKGRWIDIDDELYNPIPQALVVLHKAETSNHKAELFTQFLSSKKGQDILLSFGYSVP